MKLWLKIFLSILVVSLTTLFTSTLYVINKSHLSNIDREQDRSLNEMDFISISIQNSINITTTSEDSLRTLFSRFGEYYMQRDINLMLYREDRYIYHNFLQVDKEKYEALLSVEYNTKMVQVIEQNKMYYMFISSLISEEQPTVLLYARDISSIYHARNQSIRLIMVLAIGLIILLGSLSYLYAKWITKPIVALHKGALSISRGNYGFRIHESMDEFKDVAIAFNKMAAAVENRTSELEEKAKELQVFIDDLSHEMNTPLTSIQGYAEFLQSANASEDQRLKATQTIRSEAKRMKDIYTKLMTLTFAREHSIDAMPVNVMDLVQEVADTFYYQLLERNITLQIEVSIATLFIDRTLIHMLVSNLVKNSMQAIQSDGRIQIKAAQNIHKYIEVTDNGSGIPKDKIEDVLKPFFRVDKSRSRKTGGAGLGLSICKSIAQLHHAELIIDSQLGEGTSIKVVFPSHL